MKNDDVIWWDKFYSDLEAGLNKYVRPADWLARAEKAETTSRKPIKTGDNHG